MPRYRDHLLVIGCFLGFRLAFLALNGWASGWERAGLPVSDARAYDTVARDILAGRGFVWVLDGFPLYAFTAPLYAISLAFVYFVAGPSYDAVKLVQQGLDLASCLVVYTLASRLFNRRAGLAAAVLFAAYPAYAHYSLAVMTETLFVLLLGVALLTLWRAGERPTPATVILAGIATGFAVLARPAATSLLPAVGILLLVPWDPRRWRLVCLYVGGLAMVLLPWLLRNYLLTGGLYFAEVGSRQLWTGSNPRYGGRPFSRGAWAEVLWRDPYASELARNRRMLEESVVFVAQDPERYLRFSIARFHDLWNGLSHVPAASGAGLLATLASRVFSVVEAVVLPLGALGAIRAVCHWRATGLLGLTGLCAIAFHAVFGSDYRYRLPFDVLALVYAGYFLALLLDVRGVDWRDFRAICRRDPPIMPPRGAARRARRWLGAAGGVTVGVLLLLFADRTLFRASRQLAACGLAPETAAAAEATLGVPPPGPGGRRPSYREVWTERAGRGGRVGPLEGTPLVWAGEVRYPTRDDSGLVTAFDFFVTDGGHRYANDVIPITLPEPLPDLRDGQCVVVVGILQERAVGDDPFARPLIRARAVIRPSRDAAASTAR